MGSGDQKGSNLQHLILDAWKGKEQDTCLIFNKLEFSLDKVIEESRKLSNIFKGLGVRNHQLRVGICAHNHPIHIALILLCSGDGYFLCPLSMDLAPAQLAGQIQMVGLDVLIQPAIGKLEEGKIRVSCFGDDFDIGLKVDKVQTARDALTSIGLDQDFLMTCSSGSTGTPKPIVFTQRCKYLRALSAIEYWRLGRKDVIINASPIHHSLGQRLAIVPLLSGGCMVLLSRFTVKGWIESANDYGVTFVIPVTSHLQSLVSEQDFWRLAESKCFKGIVSSSSMLSSELRRMLVGRFGSKFYEMYGASEVGTVTVEQGDPIGSVSSDAVGRELVGVKVKIFDEAGKELAKESVIGEIGVHSPFRFSRYVHSDEVTKRAFNGDYFMTGDLGYLDVDRKLHFKGRTSDSMVTGGINVYAKDIEECLIGHERVLECKVLPVADEYLGQIPVAFVRLNENDLQSFAETKRKIKAYCAKNLASFQQPREIIPLDKFPTLGSGKVDLRQLNERLASLFRSS